MTARAAGLLATLALAALPEGAVCAVGATGTVVKSLDSARVQLADDVLTLDTGLMSRRFRWNSGNWISLAVRDGHSGQEISLLGDEPDIAIPAMDIRRAQVAPLRIEVARGDPIAPDHLLVVGEWSIEDFAVRRTCAVFPRSTAIRCQVSVRGRMAPEALAQHTRSAAMIENDLGGTPAAHFRVERLAVPGVHWRLRAVRLQAATDHNDTLVQQSESLLFREEQRLVANMLLLAPEGAARGGAQLFMIKESPSASDQIGWTGHDFRARVGAIEATASGFHADDVTPDEWTDAYAVVVGIAPGGDFALIDALRAHLETVRPLDPKRDLVVTSNSWGDRSRDARMNESFMLAEIDAAAALGLSHVQLDDGWQAGLSKNSASRAGQRWEAWTAEDWLPHPQRFPRGLNPLVERARSAGVNLGLWFNPSQADEYAAWERDADIILDFWRRYDIRQVKIDGVEVGSVAARRNLRAFLDRVARQSRGQVVFNMDVTAGRRPGYLFLNQFGNLFLENRYTDWGNYYPHRTLRNLWMLSHFLPPQWFQAEFLNVTRNPDRYAAGDPLAPAAVGFDYAFAVTTVAQPLAWMEVSRLPLELSRTDVVRRYREVQESLHAGRIFPIGSEPNGAAWTGFQSRAPRAAGEGYLIVFREPLAPPHAALRTWLTPGEAVRLEPVMGEATRSLRVTPDAEGRIRLELPRAGSWAIYRYQP